MVDHLRYHLLNEKYIKPTLSMTTAATNYKAISQYVAEKIHEQVKSSMK